MSLGCVEFLEQPAMAFVRLNEAVLLESVLEVPVPVRFLFVLLGPSQNNMDYHEIGRSFSTLMSDQVQHQRPLSMVLISSPLVEGLWRLCPPMSYFIKKKSRFILDGNGISLCFLS